MLVVIGLLLLFSLAIYLLKRNKMKSENECQSEKKVNVDNRNMQKKENQYKNSFVFNEIKKVNGVICCFSNDLNTVFDNAKKVLGCFPTIDEDTSTSMLCRLDFILNALPKNLPINKLRISLLNARALLLTDNFIIPSQEVTIVYYLNIGVDGMGWKIGYYDFAGEYHCYKNSGENVFDTSSPYSLRVVSDFLKTLLNIYNFRPY